MEDNIQKEKIEASRCIRNWARDQESYWYEDQLVGSDFQGVIELSNPKNCNDLPQSFLSEYCLSNDRIPS